MAAAAAAAAAASDAPKEAKTQPEVPNRPAPPLLKNFTFAFVGECRHGKTHLVCALTGEADAKMCGRKVESLSAAEFRDFSHCLERHKEEQTRGITIENAFHFLAPSSAAGSAAQKFTLVDTPGHRDFRKTMCRGLCAADVAVLVLSSDTAELAVALDRNVGSAREQIAIMGAIGVKRLIVAVNQKYNPPADKTKWDEDAFKRISTKDLNTILTHGNFRPQQQVKFVPVSAPLDLNISSRASDREALQEVAPWWSGTHLADQMGSLSSEQRDAGNLVVHNENHPLRILILYSTPLPRRAASSPSAGRSFVLISKILSGHVSVGTVLVILAQQTYGPLFATVERIEIERKPQEMAVAGEMCGLQVTFPPAAHSSMQREREMSLHSTMMARKQFKYKKAPWVRAIVPVARGSIHGVAGSLHGETIRPVSRVYCDVLLVNCPMQLREGWMPIMRVGSYSIQCRFRKILFKFDRRTGRMAERYVDDQEVALYSSLMGDDEALKKRFALDLPQVPQRGLRNRDGAFVELEILDPCVHLASFNEAVKKKENGTLSRPTLWDLRQMVAVGAIRRCIYNGSAMKWPLRRWALLIRFKSRGRWAECFAIWNVMTTVGLFLA